MAWKLVNSLPQKAPINFYLMANNTAHNSQVKFGENWNCLLAVCFATRLSVACLDISLLAISQILILPKIDILNTSIARIADAVYLVRSKYLLSIESQVSRITLFVCFPVWGSDEVDEGLEVFWVKEAKRMKAGLLRTRRKEVASARGRGRKGGRSKYFLCLSQAATTNKTITEISRHHTKN